MSTTCRLLCMGLFSRFFIVRPQITSPARLILPEMARALASAVHLQRGDEGFLRDVDLAELPHLLLAFLLLLQKFALTSDVAAVALCGDVLAQGADGFTRDHLAADRRLDRDLEHVRRGQLLHPSH